MGRRQSLSNKRSPTALKKSQLAGHPTVSLSDLGEVFQVVVVGPHGRAWKRAHFRLGVGPAVVLEEGLVAVIDTGDLERGRGPSVVAAGDLDVSTADVELAVCVRLVRSRLLDTDEILAGRDLGGHLEGELPHLPGNPVAIGGRASSVTPLGHLEPIAGSVVVADVAGGL